MIKERAMTLGEIVDALEGIHPDREVIFDFGDFRPTRINSYRGYYSDLALAFSDAQDREAAYAVELREMLRGAVGRSFVGYKGGNYVMSRDTNVWVANWSQCTDVAVVRVDVQRHRVILRTAMFD